MPKKIENAKALLLQEAKKLLEREGYEKLTMRSVARVCGLGVGTAYNYFSSKDELIASFMLEDWQVCLAEMKACNEEGVARLQFIYVRLQQFLTVHQSLFSDSKAKTSYIAASGDWHKQLRSQLAMAVLPVCKGENAPFLSEFIAESILRWSVEDTPFAALAPIIEKLLK